MFKIDNMKKKIHSNPEIIKQIIDKCDVCFIGMSDTEGKPYVLPFNFGFDGANLYFHAGADGKKFDILKNNPNVCVAFSADHELAKQSENVACSYSMKFRSVLAYGVIEFIDDYDEKIQGLNHIMQKYTGRSFSYNAPAVNNVFVFKLKLDNVTAKESGYF